MKRTQLFIWPKLLGIVLMLGAALSCTKYDDPAPVFEEYGEDTSQQAVRKVLFVNISGAVGQEVKKIAPPTMKELLKQAKYTWAGKSDINSGDPATWASMLMGISSERHHITDSTLSPVFEPDGDDIHDEIDFKPTFIQRMLEIDPSLNVAAITTWNTLNNSLFIEAATKITASNDQVAADSAAARLKNNDDAVTLVDFNGVNEAGLSAGFSASNAEYKNALLKIDGYIGQFLNAIATRDTYAEEEWLIIVTSNHGGLENGYGGDSEAERNTFGIFYYDKFASLEMIPNTTTAVRLHGGDDEAVKAVASGDQYNIGTGALTIELKIKLNPRDGGYAYSYPPFLSKTEARSGTTAGWSLFRAGNNINFYAADGNKKLEISGATINDGQWHSLAAVCYKEGNSFYAKLYLDGVLNEEGEVEMDAGASIQSDAPLTLGFNPAVFSSEFIDFYANDVRIWNKALPDETILELACMGAIDNSFKYRDNLIGFWPGNEGNGSTLKNKVSGAPDLTLQGDYQWQLFGAELPCSFKDLPQSTLYQNADVAPLILYWLRIPVEEEWQLDGEPWLKKFELEFL